MKREIVNRAFKVIPLTVDKTTFEKSPKEWLEAQLGPHSFKYLLAHMDDGVIWGRVENETVRASHDVVPEVSPELRAVTLLQCRLFGEKAELMVWRNEDDWKARIIQDEGNNAVDTLDEEQILWGTHWDKKLSKDGFIVVYEGQGMRHAIPIEVKTASITSTSEEFKGEKNPLRLTVRHYVKYDDDGLAQIFLSRLVNVHD